MKIKNALPLVQNVLGFLIQRGKFNTAFATTAVSGSAIYSEELVSLIDSLSTALLGAESATQIAGAMSTGGVTAVIGGLFALINLYVNYKEKK